MGMQQQLREYISFPSFLPQWLLLLEFLLLKKIPLSSAWFPGRKMMQERSKQVW